MSSVLPPDEGSLHPSRYGSVTGTRMGPLSHDNHRVTLGNRHRLPAKTAAGGTTASSTQTRRTRPPSTTGRPTPATGRAGSAMTWRHMTLPWTVPKASRSRLVPASDLNICNHLATPSDISNERKIQFFFCSLLCHFVCFLYKEETKCISCSRAQSSVISIIYYRLLGL